MKRVFLPFIAFLWCAMAVAQPGGGLLDELDALDSATEKKPDYAFATFKGVRLINGQSVELPDKGELVFMLAHRFGSMENGLYDMFGMDVATMRLGFEYTLPTDFVCFGIGHSTYRKTYDGFVKLKLFRQSTGSRNFPVSVTWVSDMAISSLRWQNPERTNYFSSRMAYMHQLLIARKFSSKLSLQLMPTVIHKNLVMLEKEQNTFFSLGVGGRMKINHRLSLNLEYFGLLPGQNVPSIAGTPVRNTFAVGVDIETGGHVFQLQLTNAQAMYDGGYLSETTTNFFAPKGRGIHFGFNLTRTFSFKKKEKKKEW